MTTQTRRERPGAHEPIPHQWLYPFAREQRKIVVVGGGLAGLRTAEALRRRGFTGSLTGMTAESLPPYERVQLSTVALTDPGWVGRSIPSSAKGFFWSLGRTAVGLDLANRQIEADDGGWAGFDALVIATGRRAVRLPFAPEVPLLHTMADAMRLRSTLLSGRGRFAVIGAAATGAAVAASARTLGWHVTVIDAEPRPLTEIVGGAPATWLWHRHRDHGVHLRFGSPAIAVRPHGTGHRIECADGSATDVDALVACVGTTADTRWLTGAGLDLHDGVRTDDRQRALTTAGTAAPHVVAVGGVTSAHTGDDAERAAATLLGAPPSPAAPPTFTTECYRHRLDVIGVPRGTESVHSTGAGFLVRYHDNGMLVGATVVDGQELLPELWQEFLAA